MDQKNYKEFSSKILLFGEYLVLLGGQSLSFPYYEYKLKRSSEYNPKNRFFFEKLVHYIETNEMLKNRICPSFKEEVQKGLSFESNIPVGYGLGSSGALVAAIYNDFFIEQATDLNILKKELAELESFFHDKSSGIDPLTSFIDKPILNADSQLEIIETIDMKNFSLVDSGKRRGAKEAIKHFNSLRNQANFNKGLEELSEISNIMTQKYLRHENIWDEMKEYSSRQYTLFNDFLTESIKIDWELGINSEKYYMKLCGAGMGGMYLKFSTIE
jgi:mevalonate kinase